MNMDTNIEHSTQSRVDSEDKTPNMNQNVSMIEVKFNNWQVYLTVVCLYGAHSIMVHIRIVWQVILDTYLQRTNTSIRVIRDRLWFLRNLKVATVAMRTHYTQISRRQLLLSCVSLSQETPSTVGVCCPESGNKAGKSISNKCDFTFYHAHGSIAPSMKELGDEYLIFANLHVPTITMDIKQLPDTTSSESDNRQPIIIIINIKE